MSTKSASPQENSSRGRLAILGTSLGLEIPNLHTGLFAVAIFHPACLGAGGGVKNR
jgi:hypothetical protein